MNKLISKGKKILFAEQTSILSAAVVIMIMIVASQLLSYIRTRFIVHFFTPAESSLFFAAFRLPDLIFEVLVYGTFSSAFIPVFTKLLKGGNGDAWDTAGRVVNIGVLIFAPVAALVAIFAEPIYTAIAPGFSPEETRQIAQIARLLLVAQIFFIVSYVLTGVLESLRRFLVPALAPIFYNIGIIFGIVLLAPKFGLIAPAIGVVIGSIAHFLIQLPLAHQLGFRFIFAISPNAAVKKIGRLSAPRLIEVSFQQLSKVVELNLSSIISTAAYTYVTLANTLHLIPVRLLGITIAKAAFPTLSRLEDDKEEFRKTVVATMNQIVFMVLPLTAILVVLRIPVVRLAFGTDLFGWEATVQTSLVLSAFAASIPFQASLALLNRSFYALHDTKTPVATSLFGSTLSIIISFTLIKLFSLPVWALAASFSVGITIQTMLLLFLLGRKIGRKELFTGLIPMGKSIFASLLAGGAMYFLIRIFDRSVWVKRLSFIGAADALSSLEFQGFVLDTRYTFNLAALTIVVAGIGTAIYLLTCFVLKSNELAALLNLIRKRKASLPEAKEPTSSDSVGA